MTNLKLFSGNANRPLAEKIANELHIPLGKARVTQFSDGESRIEIIDTVRDQNVLIVQSISPPANHHLMELLFMIDAMRRAFASRITIIIPYFGYARQDKHPESTQVPISAKVVADLLVTVGANHVFTVDLHAEQIEGFFSIPIDNLETTNFFLADVQHKNHENAIIVSPDVGGVIRAKAFAKQLNNAPLVIIDKRRPQPNEAYIMNIRGEVKNRDCIIIDDMVDTGGTVCLAAKALKEKGANKVVAYATHAVLSNDAVKAIEASALDELVVTDTIALNEAAKASPRIRTFCIASLIAEKIKNK